VPQGAAVRWPPGGRRTGGRIDRGSVRIAGPPGGSAGRGGRRRIRRPREGIRRRSPPCRAGRPSPPGPARSSTAPAGFAVRGR
jgi:hypothetical protein